MGYTTDFTGHVTVTPPLNQHEITYLTRFSDSRRMRRSKGPYHADPSNQFGPQHHDVYDIYDDTPPPGQPGLWCWWVPTQDGTAITWNGAEKFYAPADWMAYLIDTFLKPAATVAVELRALQGTASVGRAPAPGWIYPPEFDHFTFDHVVNGMIHASGQAPGDRWRLVVRDNVVSIADGHS